MLYCDVQDNISKPAALICHTHCQYFSVYFTHYNIIHHMLTIIPNSFIFASEAYQLFFSLFCFKNTILQTFPSPDNILLQAIMMPINVYIVSHHQIECELISLSRISCYITRFVSQYECPVANKSIPNNCNSFSSCEHR